MRFFRRGEPSGHDEDFWSWWQQARPRIEQAIDRGAFEPKLIEDITRAVKKLDPRLAWELAKGRQAQHALVVTPEGNPMSRQSALAWLASAPPPDATWEFYASRQPNVEPGVLEVAGQRFDFEAMRAIASWDETRRRAQIRLWHPLWPSVALAVRQQVAFLFLDDLLGEEDGERWIGQVDLLEEPTSGLSRAELSAFVQRHATEEAKDTWIAAERTDSKGQVDIVLANAGLKRIDHPFHDQHVTITIGLQGMPDDRLAAQLDAEEENLVSALGRDAILAGRTTGPFSRVIHFAGEDPAMVRSAFETWSESLAGRQVRLGIEHDPEWSFQRDLGVR